MTTHDGEIIRRSLEQPAAFAELYDRHERVVFRYAARRLGVSDADDIASETFLVAFTRRRDFTGSENARPIQPVADPSTGERQRPAQRGTGIGRGWLPGLLRSARGTPTREVRRA